LNHVRVIPEENKHLVEENIRLVPYIIQRYYGLDAAKDEDNLSIGNLALCKAAAAYNPETGIKFDTFAGKCIFNAMHNKNKVERRKRKYNNFPPMSLNVQMSSWTGDGDDCDELIDLIPDPKADTLKSAVDNNIYERYKKLMPLHAEMFELHMNENEFSKAKHVSRQRINTRMHEELRRARGKLIASGEYAAMGGG
jgi:hypothetical protein